MALLNIVEVRQNVETGLETDALQRIMNAAEQDIDQRHGAVDSQEDTLIGKEKNIWATRPVLSMTTIVECIGTTDTTLAIDDWELIHTSQLERLADGTNGRSLWGDRITITYVPIDTTLRRVATWLRLIKLDIEYSGLDSIKDGDFSHKGLDYASEREKLLSGLSRAGDFA